MTVQLSLSGVPILLLRCCCRAANFAVCSCNAFNDRIAACTVTSFPSLTELFRHQSAAISPVWLLDVDPLGSKELSPCRFNGLRARHLLAYAHAFEVLRLFFSCTFSLLLYELLVRDVAVVLTSLYVRVVICCCSRSSATPASRILLVDRSTSSTLVLGFTA